MTSLIKRNLLEVEELVEVEAVRLGRFGGDIRVVAVSKTHTRESVVVALEAGHRIFGENRVQEAKGKWWGLRDLYTDLELHLIGPLQTNKVKEAVWLFDVIETLDRVRLARALAVEMGKSGRCPRLFIQVNTGEERQKSGITPREFVTFLGFCREDLGLSIDGLMCIPPLGEDVGYHFSLLRDLASVGGVRELSMGMSGDFLVAIGYGATYIRLGTRIFGVRK